MVKLSAVLFVGLLLLGGCSLVGQCSEMRITGYGRGRTEMEATRVAWQDAKGKLGQSGLEGYAIVEETTWLGRTDRGQTVTATIRFRVVPSQMPAESAASDESALVNK